MEEPTTIRDALESAYDSAAESPAQDEVSTQVSPPSPEKSHDERPAQEALFEETAQEVKPRDERGKFKTKAKDAEGIQPGPKSEPPKPAEEIEAPQAAPSVKAPASWRPEIREHWSGLPDSVKAEVVRREQEVQKTLQETSEARKFSDAVMRTVAPYEAFIRAENSNPLQAIDNLMATAARLRTGSAPEIAQLITQLVTQHGVGRFGENFVNILDQTLAGQTPQNTGDMAVQSAVQRELAPMKQMMSQWQQAMQTQQMQAQQSATSEVNNFLSQAEFGEDLREDMADILEVAQRRGHNMTIQEAYARAASIHPEISKVLLQRQRNQTAAQQNGVAQKAKVAASSVSGGPAISAPNAPTGDIRTAIEAAIAMNSR